MKRTVVLLAVFLSAGSVSAATWTNGTQIIEKVIWKPGYHGFYVSASTYHDPEGCGAGTSYVMDPSLDEKTVDRLYAMMLTAWSTGKTVFVWVDGCSASVPKFSGLQVNN